MDNEISNIIVLGASESGVGSAVLAKKMGLGVFLSDNGVITDKYRAMISQWDIEFEEGGHSKERVEGVDLCVKSPGIPDDCEIVKYIRSCGVKVVSEIEFAAKYSKAKSICITGSNGKTTTTTLIYNILKDAGFNVGLAGNIGKSFAFQVATESYDWYVIELSSFQLDGMYSFKADVAVLMNITPDHLDRYNYDFALYQKSKFRITQNMGRGDCFIYCMDDHSSISYILNNKEHFDMYATPFSVKETLIDGAYLNGESNIEINIAGEELIIDSSKIKVVGIHNVYNVMAAAMAAIKAGVGKEQILKSVYEFEGVEHRVEKFLERDGVVYINDSKATNVDSVFYAMQGVNAPIIWIAGGKDKGNDYSVLKDVVKGRVKTLVCMGLKNQKLVDTFTNIIPFIYSTSSLEDAISVVATVKKSGDTVLLSPACASFDLFNGYEERGELFKKAIIEMENKKEK